MAQRKIKAADIVAATVTANELAANQNAGEIIGEFNGGGSALTVGTKGYIRIPYSCTINSWDLVGVTSGSVQINVYKCTYSQWDGGSTHPVVGDAITGSAIPSYSSATKNQSSTLTGWTTSLSAGDYLAFNVDSCTSVIWAALTLKVTRT